MTASPPAVPPPAPTSAPKPGTCHRCGHAHRRRGWRYCLSCEAVVRRAMADSGYLVEVPGEGPRPVGEGDA